MEMPGWRTVGDIRVTGQVGLLDGSLPRDCVLRLCLDNNTPWGCETSSQQNCENVKNVQKSENVIN